MKYLRFEIDGVKSYGILTGEMITAINGFPFEGGEETDQKYRLSDVRILAPTEPTKIIGVGLNYMDHITSQGLTVPVEPYIVHRPLNTLNSTDTIVEVKTFEHFIQFEGELVVVIGEECSDVEATDAAKYIFGYTVGNDVTDKFYFARDKHFGIAKAFDTQCPIGPWIETDFDWHNKRIKTEINGIQRQNGTTADMVFNPYELVSYLSKVMTLMPGDLIMTGSPSGVGRLENGDEVKITIDGIGSLKNKVVEKERRAAEK